MHTQIATIGNGPFNHSFGGNRWPVVAPSGSSPPAILIATLDLSDPRCDQIAASAMLPLCSRADYDVPEWQTYEIDHARNEVRFLGPPWNVEMETDDIERAHFPESRLVLRPISTAEDPVQSEDAYDTFCGGEAFIRVGGEPLWLQFPATATCACNRRLNFAACIGSERYDRPSGIAGDRRPFFLGELALFFFVCKPCWRVAVLTQST